MVTAEKKQRKMYRGYVVSDSMEKTVVALFERTYVHPRLKKVLKKVKKYKVHDENNTAKVGDLIEFYQVRPLSKTKYMWLNRVVVAYAEK